MRGRFSMVFVFITRRLVGFATRRGLYGGQVAMLAFVHSLHRSAE